MTFNKTTLPNGVRLVTIPMPDNPSVTVLVMVEAGSKYETKTQSGLSHFLEHMVFKGSSKRPKPSDISRELDSIGAHYNAFTSQEFTGYYAKADRSRADAIIDIVADMYLNPVFDAAEMEKEKGVIIEEIRMYRDLPQRHVVDMFVEALYGDQPAGWSIAGTEETVRAFTRDMLMGYRESAYTAMATTVIVAGSFDEAKLSATVAALFSQASSRAPLAKAAVRESQDAPKVALAYKETDQTHIVIGFRTFPIMDKRTPTANVLAGILGKGMSSRLFHKMREELGICYYVRADNDPFTDHGFLAIAAGVDNSRIEQGIRGITEECVRLKNELVPAAELKKVQDYMAGTTLLELETSDARAEFSGFQEMVKGKTETPEEIIAKVRTVTAEDVRALAREIFIDRNLTLAAIGKVKDEAAIRSYAVI